MEFRGPIQAGRITAEFLADYSNADPDLLIMGFSKIGGDATAQDRDVAAPGGKADVALSAEQSGTLEVIVAIGDASDSGRLRVTENGTLRDDEGISGSVHWVYSVEG